MRRLVMRSVFAAVLAFGAAMPAGAGPNDVVIVIANQNYKAGSDIDDVPYAHRDGQAFLKAAIEVLAVPNIPGRNVMMVKDAALTTMRELFSQPEREGGPITGMIRDRKARIFVYYSGHGVPVPAGEGRFAPVLLPVGVRAHQAEINGFPLDEVRNALIKMRERFAPEGEVFLILDACFSGRSAVGEIVKYASAGAIPISLAPRPGIIEIAAAQGDQVAWWDIPREHGLFTDTFVDALYSADDKDRGGNGDGTLTLGEIEAFVQDRMPTRLNALSTDGRRQRAVFPLLPGLAVTTIATPPPVRDQALLHYETQQCKLFEMEKKPQTISAFVSGCRTCTSACTAALTQRAQTLTAAMQASEAACIADRRLWGDVAKGGDLDTAKRFAANASCPEVKVDAERWIAERDGTVARKKAEAEAALLKAKQDEEAAVRKKAEEDRTAQDAAAQCDYERDKLRKLISRPLQGPITRAQLFDLFGQLQCPVVRSEAEEHLRRKRWLR